MGRATRNVLQKKEAEKFEGHSLSFKPLYHGGVKMQRGKTQFARLTELDRQIRDGRYPNALTFSGEWEVSQKTVQRDIEFLRDALGAPLAYDRTHRGYHYTDKTWFLPAMNLSESELCSLLLARRALESFHDTPIAPELRRLFDKIVETLPERSAYPSEMLLSRFTFVAPPARRLNDQIWKVLCAAVLAQQSVQIAYRSMNTGRASERVVDPYHMANLHGEWYVLAWCHQARDIRQFAVAQIQKVVGLTKLFEIREDFDAAKLLAQAFQRQVTGERLYRVRLRFGASVAETVLSRQWQREQKTKRLRNGGVELSFSTTGLFEVSRWVLSWGAACTVLAPTELKEIIIKEVTAMGEMQQRHADG
jgi:predicted DNA-binding transcriptional regulator YafY